MHSKYSTRRILLTSFCVDFLDICMNIGIAFVTQSVVMLSEALQGAADLATSTLLLIGYKRSKKRANAAFQFGYGKEIYFWTIISAMTMFFITASLSMVFGYERLIRPDVVHNTPFMLIGLIVAFVTNSYACWMSTQRLRMSTDIQSIWKSFKHSPLMEVKTAFILDLMGSASAFFGLIAFILFTVTGNYAFDGLGSIIIGITIASLSLLLIFELRSYIVGKSVDEQTIGAIKKMILDVHGVKSISDIRTMHQGSDSFMLNVDILVNDTLEAKEVGCIVNKIKDDLTNSFNNLTYIQIELDN